jgi:DNA-binding NtrC family response regulator
MDSVFRNPHGWVLGKGEHARGLARVISRVAETQSSALIVGETGAGKEIVARAIHANGPRASADFLPVNCPALAPTLFESLVFGHRKGAFTGADRSVKGILESAHQGVLFLDEIGELELTIQPKLLRALETHEFQPVGEVTPISVDVQVLSATNRDLHHAAASGQFRPDLLHRLGVIEIEVPPLRARSEGIPDFVVYFSRRYAAAFGMPEKYPDADAMRRFRAYPWPGNVRQLAAAIERAYILDLPLEPPGRRLSETTRLPCLNWRWLQREATRQALELCDGNLSRAARMCGVARNTLIRYNDVSTEAGCVGPLEAAR